MRYPIVQLVMGCAALLHVSSAQAEHYVVDPKHTYSTIEYVHFGYSTQRIRFNKTSGTIDLDPAKLNSGTIEVVLDADSVDSGNAEFDEHLRGTEFFDVAKFPKITFKSTRLRQAGGKIISVAGEVTIKGITRPVVLSIVSFHCMLHPIKQQDACGANAEAKLKRSDFGLGKYAPGVSDDVTVRVAVEALKDQR